MKKKDIFLIVISVYAGILTISSFSLKEDNDVLTSQIDSLNLSINNLNNSISSIYTDLNNPTHLLDDYNFEVKENKIHITANIKSPSKPSKVVLRYRDSTKDTWSEKEMITSEYPTYTTSINFNPSKEYNFSLYFIEDNKEYPFKMDSFSFKNFVQSSVVHSMNLYYDNNSSSIVTDFYLSINIPNDNNKLFNIKDLTYKIIYDGKIIKEYTTKDFGNKSTDVSNTFLLQSAKAPIGGVDGHFNNLLLKGEFIAKDLAGNVYKGTSLNNDLDITLFNSNN